MDIKELEDRAYALIRQKYIMRQDERQRSMGLEYTEMEIHDLARVMARFAADMAAAIMTDDNPFHPESPEGRQWQEEAQYPHGWGPTIET